MKWLMVVALCLPFQVWSADLKFQYLDGDQFVYEGDSTQTVLLNGKQLQKNTSTFRSQYAATVVDGQVHLAVATGFDARILGAHSTAQTSDSKQVEYSVDPQGVYSVPEGSALPVVRSVPTFADHSVTENQTWSAPGSEVIDLSGIAIFSQNKAPLAPMTISFPVSYRYQGTEDKDGRSLDVIDLEYNISYRPGLSGADYRVYPVLMSGKTSQKVYFDSSLGLQDSYSEEYVLDLVLSNGDIYEFSGTSTVTLEPTNLKERPVAVAEAPPTTRADASADASSEAPATDQSQTAAALRVKPTFEPVSFPPNTAVLTDEERQNLDAMAEILKGWQGDVLIEGFAAEVGAASRQKSLSEERANAVRDYLVSLGVRTADHIVVSARGAQVPVAPNDSIENRAKNRRAVVLLLDE